eukprot:CAMPEP_0168249108 /NCGR_PEP_ID=MMETSP0141_2-20121125/1825_1 /TAXON_ID=44445 /ORGANISM="Pseudo-nitzschia australis, Strain 10249 10 AB" /LENGTH=503 /DNA_ID=CAMNT_0008185079 /DNA_START=104 /DNA_END=1615 /DNA_ORIENTATION=+
MPSLNKREAAVTEAKRAVLLFIVFHVCAFVVMMGYRLHTQRYYLSQAAIAEELSNTIVVPEPSIVPKKKKEKKPKIKIIDDSPLERYEAPMQLLSNRLSEAQESIRINTEIIHRHMNTLGFFDQKIENLLQSLAEEGDGSDEGDDDAQIQSAVRHWRELMSVGSLREIPHEQLGTVFADAANTITEIVRFNRDGDRSKKNDYGNKLIKRFIFDTGLGSRIAKEPSEFFCPIPSAEFEDDDSDTAKKVKDPLQKLEGAAYETDLEDRLKNFEEIFGNRIQANGIQALLPKSIEEIQEEMEEQLEDVFDDITDLVDDLEAKVEKAEADRLEKDERSISLASCINENLVTTLITAGLNAQAAHTDVREALRRTILQFDTQISEDELILDADLDAIGARASNIEKSKGRKLGGNGGPVIKNINFRSMIDTPLLTKSIDWIDILVDAVGGYSDELDSYLDSLAGFHGTTSVGEILVENLLEQAGRAGELDAQKYFDKAQNKVQEIIGK